MLYGMVEKDNRAGHQFEPGLRRATLGVPKYGTQAQIADALLLPCF